MVIVFDLDDTLYDEVDFVRSGFAEVACYLNLPEAEAFMWKQFTKHGSGRIFDALITKYNLKVPLQKLIEIYRFHIPNIFLDAEALALLQFARDYHTALISDGHYLMQRNKFHALGLEPQIDYPLFTDCYETKKPEQKPFLMVMEHFRGEENFIYVSDNPLKDFEAPKALGWQTLRLRNPKGVYRDVPNTADAEAKSRGELLGQLREMCK
jgi:putative hydrolase of the HAD superfamily